ncbi:MAG TPA: cytochrome c [Rhodothermales bacterium]|nr:cytochrome c [Rhodothermales bacterium]
MKILLTIIGCIIVLVAAFFLFVFSGVYNIAASDEHSPFMHWVLNTTMEHSVEDHAADVQVPPLNDPALARTGFEHYKEMCETCHGAPGVDRSEIGQGLNPLPPDLTKIDPDWSEKELFWTVKHGIKMTGMPSFGETHSDDKIWAIVAFVRQLRDMSPQQYQALSQQLEPGAEEYGEEVQEHTHEHVH